MYGHITKRHERMKRLPPVTAKDYVLPLLYGVAFVPMLYVGALLWYVVTPVILGVL